MAARFTLSEPQRKRRVWMRKEPPFPVPISNITGCAPSVQNWYHYTGSLEGNLVVVRDRADMDFLWKMGFFGKGSTWYGGGGDSYVIRRRERGGEDKVLRLVSQPLKSVDQLVLANQQAGDKVAPPPGELQDSLPPLKKRLTEGKAETILEKTDFERSHDQYVDEQTLQLDSKPQEVIDPWETSTAEEAATFWGLETQPVVAKETPVVAMETHPVVGKETPGSAVAMGTQSVVAKETPAVAMETQPVVAMETPAVAMETQPVVGKETPAVAMETPAVAMETKVDESKVSEPASAGEKRERDQISAHSGRKISNEIQDVNRQTACKERQEAIRDVSCDITLETEAQCSLTGGSTCVTDKHKHGIAQIDDVSTETDDVTHEGDKGTEGQATQQPREQSGPREGTFQPGEHLQLTLEEAFFLSYGLGCLSVLDHCKRSLTLTELWRECVQKSADFLPHYIVYHNLRSKGWVPKPGLQFGVDYIVYREGPPFYHASYSVVIRMVNGSDLEDDLDLHQRSLTWTSLAGLNRITESVHKEVMICYVIKPTDLTAEDLQSPRCISKFKVQEVVLRRWVSARERDNVEYYEIP